MSHRLLLSFICSITVFSNFASTFPHIVSRQCDSEWCLPGLDFDPVEALLGGAAAGWGAITNFVIPPPSPTTDENSDTQFRTTPDTEQNVVPPTDQEQCQNLPGWQSGPGSANNNGCKATTKQIVWPLSCERTPELIALEGVMKRMDSGLLTSIEVECNGGEGVFFWSGAFNKDQIDLIARTYPGLVAGVEPNGPVYETSFQQVAKTPKTQPPDEPNGLTFISTAPGTIDSGQYAYIRQDKWPARITVFEFGTGFDLERPEFAGIDKSWIYAIGTREKPEADDDYAHGTCMASLVMGNLYGVAKNLPSLIAVKIRLEEDAILDGWKQIINVLTGWRKRGRPSAGYTVIHAALSSHRDGFLHETKYRSLIEILVRDFQVVIVCSAGQNRIGESAMDSPDGNVYFLPAKFSLDYDIITVGAVNILPGNDFGIQHRATHGGSAVTVYGPFSGRCSMEFSINPLGWEDVGGTSPASAYTAGLAAYFLGLPDLGPWLRGSQPNIPKAVKEYIQSKAYSRNAAGTFPAIWNGLDAYDTIDGWTYWIGDPNVDTRPAPP